VHGCRFVTQQLVPASPEVEHTVRDGSRYICVGLDALSAADELVEGVSLDLQQVIGKLRQATHTKYVPSVDFGANKVAVLHTLIQVSRAVCSMQPFLCHWSIMFGELSFNTLYCLSSVMCAHRMQILLSSLRFLCDSETYCISLIMCASARVLQSSQQSVVVCHCVGTVIAPCSSTLSHGCHLPNIYHRFAGRKQKQLLIEGHLQPCMTVQSTKALFPCLHPYFHESNI